MNASARSNRRAGLGALAIELARAAGHHLSALNSVITHAKALAEHVARHPEDAGRTVDDFKWIAHVIVRPAA
jgi:hypothetical protein